jgi:hypothetical protein
VRTDNLNSHIRWSKTKESRATACRTLGFESFIARSVLGKAFNAIVGVIWLDYDAQELQTPTVQSGRCCRMLARSSSMSDEDGVPQSVGATSLA